MKNHHWYRVLRKPSWAPPEWLFAPVWIVLYILMAVSFGYVWFLYFNREISGAIMALFVFNLAFNLAFTPILFGFCQLGLVLADVFLTLATLALGLILIYPFAPWVVFANVPYLLWLIFAAILQLKITMMNRRGRQAEISFI